MFNEILQIAEKRFSVDMKRATAHAKFAVVEASIIGEDAELSFLESTICQDEMTLIMEQASNDAIKKIKIVIYKMIEKIKEFIKTIKNKILYIISSEKSKKDIESLEKKVKLDPLIRNKKVSISNKDKHIPLAKKTLTKYAQLVTKIKSGKKVEKIEVDNIRNLFKKEYAIIAASTTTISILSLCAINKARMSSMEKEIDDIQNAGIRIMEEVSDSLDMDNHISDVGQSISEDVGEVISLCSISPLQSFAEATQAVRDAILVKGNMAILPDGKMITVDELDDDKKQLLAEKIELLRKSKEE